MGRVKLKIQRLENTSGRQITYSKRRCGILKKAKEISILCDIDIALVMFSPTGKPTLCLGERSNIDDVVAKFALLPPQEREKRKLESLEALKKMFQRLDHEVKIQDFLGSRQTIEDLSEQSSMLQTQVKETYQRLSRWTDPADITDMERLKSMEVSLRKSLIQVRAQKEIVQKQGISSEYLTKFDNGLLLPLGIDGAQQSQQMAWLQGNDAEQPFMEPPLQSTQGKLNPSTQEPMVPMFGFDQNAYLSHQLGELPCHQYDLSSLFDKRLMSQAKANFSDGSENYQIDGFQPTIPDFVSPVHNWATSVYCASSPIFDEQPYSQQPDQN